MTNLKKSKKSVLKGLSFNRLFTKEGVHPFEEVTWMTSDATVINYKDSSKSFSQHGVVFPSFWDPQAVNMVSSKFFCGALNSKDREYDLRQLIGRVVSWLIKEGDDQGYFLTEKDKKIFEEELIYLLLHQYVSFNSPVWFNIGNKNSKPQASACFILSAEDSMESIKENEVIETSIFENGSGCGSNRSNLRSSYEEISGGGIAMGPLRVMEIYDKIAKGVKSGGITRRAAKMDSLNADHGNIFEFIEAKKLAEDVVRALVSAGYSKEFDDEKGAYNYAIFQNSNFSVRLKNIFMEQLLAESRGSDGMFVDTWALLARYPVSRLYANFHEEIKAAYEGDLREKNVQKKVQGTFFVHKNLSYLVDTSGERIQFVPVLKWVRVKDIMNRIADCAWDCADPGLQFHDTINKWNTCSADGEINASNPCAEYNFLDDTSCNLASHRLTAYLDKNNDFEYDVFIHANGILLTACDIYISRVYYPTEKISEKTKKYRTIGIGYSDVGLLLLEKCLPYDSSLARMYIGAITATMTFSAYKQSQLIASSGLGAFERYEENKVSVKKVLEMHNDELLKLSEKVAKYDVDVRDNDGIHIIEEIDNMITVISDYIQPDLPVRNAQVTVIAPTGTISFYLGAKTTGIEPVLGFITRKDLVGGGTLQLMIPEVSVVLKRLSYTDKEIVEINEYVAKNNTFTGSPHLIKSHLPIFATSFSQNNKETNILSYQAHIDMMAAVQPFISGAISKTVNMPEHVTPKEIIDTYLYAWKSNLKCIALYRDKCKESQPLYMMKTDDILGKESFSTDKKSVPSILKGKDRVKLPNNRPGDTHKFNIGGVGGLITYNVYPEDMNRLGEIILKIYKSGQSMSAIMDLVAILVSNMLQYGIPLEVIVGILKNVKFEPNGFTNNPDIPAAQSIADYIAKFLEITFLNRKDNALSGDPSIKEEDVKSIELVVSPHKNISRFGGVCPICGGELVQAGNCKRCNNCYSTTGCGS